MKHTPRGIRNHNPGNIRWGSPWQGLIPEAQRTDKAFCQFQSAAYGIRALAVTLITYQDKHKLRTIEGIITRWAPPSENKTTDYIASVSIDTEMRWDKQLDMHNYAHLRAVLEAIIHHENGKGPLDTPNTWYDEQTIDKGLMMAGIQAPKRTAAKIPVTRETIGATATGSVGVAEIVDVIASLPADTLTQANAHLSSGSTIRLAIGVALIAVAAFIAWSQVKRYQAGTL